MVEGDIIRIKYLSYEYGSSNFFHDTDFKELCNKDCVLENTALPTGTLCGDENRYAFQLYSG